jgi:hypothetical protein
MRRNAPSSESSNPKSDEAVMDWLDAHDHVNSKIPLTSFWPLDVLINIYMQKL